MDVSSGKTAQNQIRTNFVFTAKVHMERTVDGESEASGIIPEFSEDWLCVFEPANFSENANLRTNEGNGW